MSALLETCLAAWRRRAGEACFAAHDEPNAVDAADLSEARILGVSFREDAA